ncbi:MAG: 50S ribosomal protein L20 [Bacteroidetes bacterium]|nr:50S ribosomal protein L20 [Rhodothermia bacterium]MCS7154648.1 50S ribosomal protein L20 [Bacteroidota bacterium]MCX7906365.1 50S ribosomal protein L20 [Bacteroidota bacterium]MDW8137441.1 50S ribosomal protein L20 [Bacteroidota bacterium]MDW8285605.1 50S ribosomal protein L20 [Bacteroidota bacterium]
MPRATNSVASRRRRKKILKQAKGFWGRRSKNYTIAKYSVEKALQYAYRDRRQRKRDFRRLWIVRINAAARLHGTTYSRLIEAMHKKGIAINRKLLADLAVRDPQAFASVVQRALS